MQSTLMKTVTTTEIPFDNDKLGRLMDTAGVDVLIASSKHNVGYLLDGYRFFFFEGMDAKRSCRQCGAKGRAESSI